jgi:hypothetical protein
MPVAPTAATDDVPNEVYLPNMVAATSTEHLDAAFRNRPHKRSLVMHTLDADGATMREAELWSVVATRPTCAEPR